MIYPMLPLIASQMVAIETTDDNHAPTLISVPSSYNLTCNLDNDRNIVTLEFEHPEVLESASEELSNKGVFCTKGYSSAGYTYNHKSK